MVEVISLCWGGGLLVIGWGKTRFETGPDSIRQSFSLCVVVVSNPFFSEGGVLRVFVGVVFSEVCFLCCRFFVHILGCMGVVVKGCLLFA